MADMTPTQGRYLGYIHAYTEGFGLPPAESEIAEAIGVAPPSVNQMMKTLEKKGLIRRKPRTPRSIEVLVPSDALPKWKGKRITRTVWEWRRTRPAARRRNRCDAVRETDDASSFGQNGSITSRSSGSSIRGDTQKTPPAAVRKQRGRRGACRW